MQKKPPRQLATRATDFAFLVAKMWHGQGHWAIGNVTLVRQNLEKHIKKLCIMITRTFCYITHPFWLVMQYVEYIKLEVV